MSTTYGWALVVVGLSVSIDELAVGFTLGLSRVPVPVVPALVLTTGRGCHPWRPGRVADRQRGGEMT